MLGSDVGAVYARARSSILRHCAVIDRAYIGTGDDKCSKGCTNELFKDRGPGNEF